MKQVTKDDVEAFARAMWARFKQRFDCPWCDGRGWVRSAIGRTTKRCAECHGKGHTREDAA